MEYSYRRVYLSFVFDFLFALMICLKHVSFVFIHTKRIVSTNDMFKTSFTFIFYLYKKSI